MKRNRRTTRARGLLAALEPPKRSKYGARRVTVDGVTFDSKGEADRWCELKLEERAGEIRKLQRQVEIPLIGFSMFVAGGEQCAVFKADFTYERADRHQTSGWRQVVEDFKSDATAEKESYQLKRRLFRVNYGFDISEVRKSKGRRR